MKAKILIADDEKEIRDVVKMLLEGEGYEVMAAADGQEALSLADASVDLYILDVNMPKLSGFGAAAEIRKHYYAPILFLTAYSGESDKVMGFSVGGDDYLVKPFAFEEELKEKTDRLNTLNIELNLDEKAPSAIDTEPEQSDGLPERKSRDMER